jgi:hypothetical protein
MKRKFYLKANLGGEYQKLIVKDFQAQTVSGKTYYRVKVTQKSPVYFMTLLGLDPLTDVSADAVAQVGSAGSSSSGFGFKDLIVANHISEFRLHRSKLLLLVERYFFTLFVGLI